MVNIMKIKKLRYRFIIIIIIVVILISFVVVREIRKNKGSDNNEIILETNKKIPKIKVSDATGKKSTLAFYCEKSIKEKTLIIYLSVNCEACLELIDTIKLLHSFDNSDIQILILWENDIPTELLKEEQLDSSFNISIDGKINGINKPMCYLINNNKLVLEEKTEYIVAAVNSIYKNKYTKDDVINYINNIYSQEYLFFSDTNCEGCNEFNERIEGNNIDDNFVIISKTKDYKVDFVDAFGIVNNSYLINKYPSVIEKSSSEIIEDLNSIIKSISH